MHPGVYQLNFRGLTLREAWRFSGEPFKFLLALVLKAAAFKGSRQWLPAHECEASCTEDQLSPEASVHLLPAVAEARALGYDEGRFHQMVRILDPNIQQGFGYAALHRDRRRFLFIGLVVGGAPGRVKPVLAFSGALVTTQAVTLEFLNHRNHLDNSGVTQKIMVRGKTLGAIDAAMQQTLAAGSETFRTFARLEAVQQHLRDVEVQAFDTRIARGLLRYVGRDEVPPLPSSMDEPRSRE